MRDLTAGHSSESGPAPPQCVSPCQGRASANWGALALILDVVEEAMSALKYSIVTKFGKS
jgi:hypothetical protein